MLDVYCLAPKSGIATDRHAEFKAWMSCIFDWNDNSKKTEGTLPIRPEHFDRRISLQQGCFTFHALKPGQAVLEKTDPAVRALTIATGRKKEMLKELSALNVNHFSVFRVPGRFV